MSAFSWAFDDLSLILLTVILALGAYLKYFSTPPPLVHPLLLGKQSEVSQTRKKGESGIYRAWATGHSGAPLATRPAGSVKCVADLASTECDKRSLLGMEISNDHVRRLAVTFLHGLQSALSSFGPSSSQSETILMLLPPIFQALVLHLAKSQTTSLNLITLASPKFLIPALDSKEHPSPRVFVVNSALLPDLLEQIIDDAQESVRRPLVIVVDDDKDTDTSKWVMEKASRVKDSIDVMMWDDLIIAGITLEEKSMDEEKPLPMWTLPNSKDMHCVCYVSGPTESPLPVSLTNENITAGVAGVLSSFPADKRPAPAWKDTFASGIDIDTPFGLTLLLTSMYTGSAFMAVGEYGSEPDKEDPYTVLKADPQQKPTILFIGPTAFSIAAAILDKTCTSSSSPLLSLAKRHKLAGLSGGYLGRDWPFEWLVWDPIRTGLPARGHLVAYLRAVFVVQDSSVSRITAEDIDIARMVASVPVSRMFASPLSSGPILATHFYDLRPTKVTKTIGSLPLDNIPHLGPPASNMEVVLKGSEVERVEEGMDPVGKLMARGPAIAKSASSGDEGWIDFGVEAAARADGTFVVLPSGAIAW